MAIVSSSTHQDYPQRDGRRHVLHVFQHDVKGDVQRRRWLNPADDADADRVALEPVVDQQVFDGDAEAEAQRQQEVVTDGDWDAGTVGTVADSKKAIAARLLRIAAAEQDSFRAWKILKKVVPWILTQGWTVGQIANYLGVTNATVTALNQRWVALSGQEATFAPLISAINVQDQYTVITADTGVVDWVES